MMHEVGGESANLRAVPEQSDVVLLRMRLADLQAMRHRFDAPAVRLLAQLDAAFHLVGHVRHLHSSSDRGLNRCVPLIFASAIPAINRVPTSTAGEHGSLLTTVSCGGDG